MLTTANDAEVVPVFRQVSRQLAFGNGAILSLNLSNLMPELYNFDRQCRNCRRHFFYSATGGVTRVIM